MKPFERVYLWTPALTAELRRAYSLRGAEKSAALDTLETRSGWPRSALINEARRLNLSRVRRWAPAEVIAISSRAGELDAERLARRLGRTVESVRVRAKRLGLSVRIREGYSLSDIRDIFGVGPRKLDSWLQRELLGRPVETSSGIRIRDAALVHFIEAHMEEYSLRLADETFIKGVLNGHREGIPGEVSACAACRGKEAGAGSRRSA